MTRVLGAVIAGGRARRFGGDKAAALLDGRPLIDHVADTLALECDAVIVCGRWHARLLTIADRPEGGRGPLAGIAAALRHAEDHGFDLVLTAPCDTPRVPAGLLALLAPAPAYLAGCPVIGLWPAALADTLDAHLGEAGSGAMRRWAIAIGAAARGAGLAVPNVNTPEDLVRLS